MIRPWLLSCLDVGLGRPFLVAALRPLPQLWPRETYPTLSEGQQAEPAIDYQTTDKETHITHNNLKESFLINVWVWLQFLVSICPYWWRLRWTHPTQLRSYSEIYSSAAHDGVSKTTKPEYRQWHDYSVCYRTAKVKCLFHHVSESHLVDQYCLSCHFLCTPLELSEDTVPHQRQHVVVSHKIWTDDDLIDRNAERIKFLLDWTGNIVDTRILLVVFKHSCNIDLFLIVPTCLYGCVCCATHH